MGLVNGDEEKRRMTWGIYFPSSLSTRLLEAGQVPLAKMVWLAYIHSVSWFARSSFKLRVVTYPCFQPRVLYNSLCFPIFCAEALIKLPLKDILIWIHCATCQRPEWHRTCLQSKWELVGCDGHWTTLTPYGLCFLFEVSTDHSLYPFLLDSCGESVSSLVAHSFWNPIKKAPSHLWVSVL